MGDSRLPPIVGVEDDMKNVVITGANRGIGLELAKLYLEAGDCVIAGCRNPAAAAELSRLAGNNRLSVLGLDVSVEASVADFASQVGSAPIDILINNAGVMGGDRQSVEDIDFAEWLLTLRINTVAPMQLAMALKPGLCLSDRPRVITISSQMGALSRRSKGAFAYRSSKAAVNKVMQVLALEWEDDSIICCPIHPGWVRTDMGGPNADIDVVESARGIVSVIDKLTMASTGKFYCWNGDEHAW